MLDPAIFVTGSDIPENEAYLLTGRINGSSVAKGIGIQSLDV